MTGMDVKRFLAVLKRHAGRLTRQQIKTLRRQALAGNVEGAMKGLRKIIGG